MKRDQETSGTGAGNKRAARSSLKPASSAPSRVRSVLNLQRSAGNRAVSSRLATAATPIPIQRDSSDLVAAIGSGTTTDINEVAATLMDVIGESSSPTSLASSLRSTKTHGGGKEETLGDGVTTPEATDGATPKPKYTRPEVVTAETLGKAKQKALGGKVELSATETNTALQTRYTTIAGLRSSRQKLFGSPFNDQQVTDLPDLTKNSDEDFSTISSRYKTLGPLAAKLKKAYGADISKAEFKVADGKMNLGKLLDPTTSDEDFAQFQTDLTTKTKTVTDLEEIKKLEGELAKSDLHLNPKSDAALKAMTPQKQAIYLKYLKKKADDVNADEEDTFAQQEMNKQLLKGFQKQKMKAGGTPGQN